MRGRDAALLLLILLVSLAVAGRVGDADGVLPVVGEVVVSLKDQTAVLKLDQRKREVGLARCGERGAGCLPLGEGG